MPSITISAMSDQPEKPKPGDSLYFSGDEVMAEATERIVGSARRLAEWETVERRRKAEAAIRSGQPKPAGIREDFWEKVQTEAIKWSKSSGQDIAQFGLTPAPRFNGTADQGNPYPNGKPEDPTPPQWTSGRSTAQRDFTPPHGHPEAKPTTPIEEKIEKGRKVLERLMADPEVAAMRLPVAKKPLVDRDAIKPLVTPEQLKGTTEEDARRIALEPATPKDWWQEPVSLWTVIAESAHCWRLSVGWSSRSLCPGWSR